MLSRVQHDFFYNLRASWRSATIVHRGGINCDFLSFSGYLIIFFLSAFFHINLLLGAFLLAKNLLPPGANSFPVGGNSFPVQNTPSRREQTQFQQRKPMKVHQFHLSSRDAKRDTLMLAMAGFVRSTITTPLMAQRVNSVQEVSIRKVVINQMSGAYQIMRMVSTLDSVDSACFGFPSLHRRYPLPCNGECFTTASARYGLLAESWFHLHKHFQFNIAMNVTHKDTHVRFYLLDFQFWKLELHVQLRGEIT